MYMEEAKQHCMQIMIKDRFDDNKMNQIILHPIIVGEEDSVKWKWSHSPKMYDDREDAIVEMEEKGYTVTKYVEMEEE